MPAQRIKHVYSAITLTSNDLATIAWLWSQVTEPVLRANAYHLQSIDELAEVVREDQVVDSMSIVATSDQRWLSFAYQPGYVLIELSPPGTWQAPARAGMPSSDESWWARMTRRMTVMMRGPRPA